MGLIECASGNSIWRGIDYCERNKVVSWKGQATSFDGIVSGSNGEEYKVHVDVEHPRIVFRKPIIFERVWQLYASC